MKDENFKIVEKIFYNYPFIEKEIQEELNKYKKRDINQFIKSNYKKSLEEIEVIKKIDNKKIQKLLKEKQVVDKTLEKYKNDFKIEIIKRRYFKKEKNYIIYDSMRLWKQQYFDIVKDIIHYASLIALKENLINL